MHFVVIASPRTGSTHLVSLLNTRDDILCNGEILHDKYERLLVRWPKSERKGKFKNELMELRRRDPEAFLKHILDRNCGRAHVGFKVLPKHNDELLGKIVLDCSIKKVVLFRHNVLAAYSSTRIAQDTGNRHDKTVKVDRPVVEFEERVFRSYCERYLAFYRDIFAKLNDSGQPFHLVHYEGVNDTTLFENLLKFLGAKGGVGPLVGKRSKRNTPDILSRFTNPDAVTKFLAKNGLTGWSHETRISFDLFEPANARRDRRSETPSELTAMAL